MATEKTNIESLLTPSATVLIETKRLVDETDSTHVDFSPSYMACEVVFGKSTGVLLNNQKVLYKVLENHPIEEGPLDLGNSSLGMPPTLPPQEVYQLRKAAQEAYRTSFYQVYFDFQNQINQLFIYAPVSIKRMLHFLPEHERLIVKKLRREYGTERSEAILNEFLKTCERNQWRGFWKAQFDAFLVERYLF